MDRLEKSEIAADEGHTHGDVNKRDVTGFVGGSAPLRKPSNDPSLHHAHPINFPTWRKTAILVSLAWSGFAANYCASAHLTAFPEIAESLGVTIPLVANTIGYGLLGIAVGPLFWNREWSRQLVDAMPCSRFALQPYPKPSVVAQCTSSALSFSSP